MIGAIEQHNVVMRDWDVPFYLDEVRYDRYEIAWSDLRRALLPESGRGLTLVSKVMMGAWGCVPSFDTPPASAAVSNVQFPALIARQNALRPGTHTIGRGTRTTSSHRGVATTT
ncbi:hypothetical protein [Georgenia thermotolerans]|uniref:Uncharacterized protein n=1 Tax=Georgenia thermotolerans TaxID=527326 RepID=A0A7J5UUG4_9MICO|nr:hypothetical protein [Georgenia thermotolerans]KAE8765935.1 hypothetical protein GB883_01550 [Georgenia thermotolerans]